MVRGPPFAILGLRFPVVIAMSALARRLLRFDVGRISIALLSNVLRRLFPLSLLRHLSPSSL